MTQPPPSTPPHTSRVLIPFMLAAGAVLLEDDVPLRINRTNISGPKLHIHAAGLGGLGGEHTYRHHYLIPLLQLPVTLNVVVALLHTVWYGCGTWAAACMQ